MNRFTTKLIAQATLLCLLSVFALGCGDDPVGINAAPVVSIDAPLNESRHSGVVDLKATVTDDKAVTKVVFIVDGHEVGTDTEAPYEAIWNSPGDGALHSVNVEAFDADGAVTNTVVRVWADQGTTVVVTNRLLRPVNITVNGVLVGSVDAQSVGEKYLGKVDSVDLRWSLVRYTTTAGDPVGDAMTGHFEARHSPSGTEEYEIDNQINVRTFMVPVVTNTTNVGFLMAVNMGLPQENRCNCVVRENSTSIAIGYYEVFSGGNIRAFPEQNGYTGRYITWDEGVQYTVNDLEPATGRINLLADFIPATRPGDPNGSILRPTLPPRRSPARQPVEKEWNAPTVPQAPLLPLR